ncbi:hypothetical protein ACFOHS_20170 [Jhaorihella thermophila]
MTRIVSDVDALDGVVLRLILPLGAAILTHVLVFAVLGLIVGWSVAVVIAGLYLSFGLAILLRLGRRTVAPASEAETQGQHLRRGVIDMIRDREALIVAAVLKSKEDRLRQIDGAAREAARQLDRAERMSGFWMSLLIAGVAMSAFSNGSGPSRRGVCRASQSSYRIIRCTGARGGASSAQTRCLGTRTHVRGGSAHQQPSS